MEIRFDSEDEFREFAADLKRQYPRIQIRVTENLLVHKFFVYIYRWCKDYPGGGWGYEGYFVTKDREVAMRLYDLEGRGQDD